MIRLQKDKVPKSQDPSVSKNEEEAIIKTQIEINRLLVDVISQAKALGIPVSSHIESNVVINKRAKSRFGCCRKIQGKKQNEPRYVIEISAALLEAPIESIREVLAHEVLHTSPAGDNHTGLWKKYAGMMNQSYGYHIKRTNSPESLGLSQEREQAPAKYLIICKKCGIVQERSRISKVIKQPSLYRCKCGGKLKVKNK